jgi:hypothetical protein
MLFTQFFQANYFTLDNVGVCNLWHSLIILRVVLRGRLNIELIHSDSVQDFDPVGAPLYALSHKLKNMLRDMARPFEVDELRGGSPGITLGAVLEAGLFFNEVRAGHLDY